MIDGEVHQKIDTVTIGEIIQGYGNHIFLEAKRGKITQRWKEPSLPQNSCRSMGIGVKIDYIKRKIGGKLINQIPADIKITIKR